MSIYDTVDLQLGSLTIPVPWFQSIDALASIIAVPLLFAIWRYQAAHRGEPGDLGKIGTGAWLAAISNLVLASAVFAADGAPVNAIWAVLYCTGMGIAFIYYWPTLLALVSRAAPARANATMMGIVFLTLFVSNNLVGWVGGFYERMSPVAFWLTHAAIAATGGLLVLIFGRHLHRILHSD